MEYRIQIDPQSCQSSGRCVQAAPEAFVLDADHLATPRPGARMPDGDTLLAIARGCPALAIHLFDAEGREVEL